MREKDTFKILKRFCLLMQFGVNPYTSKPKNLFFRTYFWVQASTCETKCYIYMLSAHIKILILFLDTYAKTSYHMEVPTRNKLDTMANISLETDRS